MSEVHATWAQGGAPLCGMPGEKSHGERVIIRTPDDWRHVSCHACHYSATKGEW